MKNKLLKVLSVRYLTHDVLEIRIEKPQGVSYLPGQATELAINKSGWENEGRPFTFTSLPTDDYLEFCIKSYTDHNGVTNELRNLKAGDEVLLTDIFGAIEYKGKGTFIAGGAGLTPFLCILRDLKAKGQLDGHRLLFANKTKEDIILKDELISMLGGDFRNILSNEEFQGYAKGFMDANYIKENATSLSDYFYICGPDPMTNAVEKHLLSLGVKENQIIKEQ
ncbi:MAG: flavodoxin reductase [Brumimicrobium sp.]|nr:flavodoxin reductase [Brumimicrobium sp.]